MTLTRGELDGRREVPAGLPQVALPLRSGAVSLLPQRLERSDDLLEAAFDAVNIPAAVLDGNGRILLVNAPWREVTRLPDSAIDHDRIGADYFGVGIPDATIPRHAAALRAGLRKLLRRGAESFECPVCVKQTGSDRWYLVRATRIEVGGSDRIVVTHEDITALHTAQESVKALSRRLLTLQEEERQRIAVELHDSTSQQLTAANLHLLALRETLQQNPLALQAIEQIERTIGEAQKELRSFSYLLHPPYLNRDGLRTTLTRFVDGYGRRTGLTTASRVTLEVDGLSPAAQIALLRIVQEAFSNIHRHAAATKVTVNMKTTKTSLLFNIRDNGRGMSHLAGRNGKQREQPLGLGIPGMRARVGQLGGSLRILSGSRGTTISGKLPLSPCQP